MSDRFEDDLQAISDKDARMGVIDVADSMGLGLQWFRDHKIQPTAAELLRFAELVLDRQMHWTYERRREDEAVRAAADARSIRSIRQKLGGG